MDVLEYWRLGPEEFAEQAEVLAERLAHYDRLLLEACASLNVIPLRLGGGGLDRTTIEHQLRAAGFEVREVND